MSLAKLVQDPHAALVVVDQQIDFEPGGALSVAGGDEIAEPISRLMLEFQHIIVSQDSHPPGHISFASSYKFKKAFDRLTLEEVEGGKVVSRFSKETLLKYLSLTPHQEQILWPDHCVINTRGWLLDPKIRLERATLLLRKGTRIDCDSYSVFFENDGSPTGLGGFLKEKEIRRLLLVGLAGDYCVFWSAQDGIRLGFEVYLDESLTRFVNFPQGRREGILAELKNEGVKFVDNSSENAQLKGMISEV